MLFDVFGKKMQAVRTDNAWSLFWISPEGKRRRVDDVIVPSSLSEEELPGYLDDLYHEYATNTHPSVLRIH
ncbi:MAG: DUF7661 family protein [Nitrospiraceae bacterium]